MTINEKMTDLLSLLPKRFIIRWDTDQEFTHSEEYPDYMIWNPRHNKYSTKLYRLDLFDECKYKDMILAALCNPVFMRAIEHRRFSFEKRSHE